MSEEKESALEAARHLIEDVVTTILTTRIPQLDGRVTCRVHPTKDYVFEVRREDALSAHVKLGSQFSPSTRMDDLATAAYQVAAGLTSAVVVRQEDAA